MCMSPCGVCGVCVCIYVQVIMCVCGVHVCTHIHVYIAVWGMCGVHIHMYRPKVDVNVFVSCSSPFCIRTLASRLALERCSLCLLHTGIINSLAYPCSIYVVLRIPSPVDLNSCLQALAFSLLSLLGSPTCTLFNQTVGEHLIDIQCICF